MEQQRGAHPASEVEALLAPTPYRFVRILGQGRHGDLYEIEHEFLGRRFALKLLRNQGSAQDIDRMRIEAQTLARLRHPNVVDIVDFRHASTGLPYLVMELLHGHTLDRELLERGRLPIGEAADLACQALSALHAAHQVGVVHRDLTPDNLYLHRLQGGDRILKVLDFGLARVQPGASARAPSPLVHPTAKGSRVGSPRFMSPEAIRGESSITAPICTQSASCSSSCSLVTVRSTIDPLRRKHRLRTFRMFQLLSTRWCCNRFVTIQKSAIKARKCSPSACARSLVPLEAGEP